MTKSPMFTQMNQAALARLNGRDPREIAQNAGIRYDEDTQVFHVPTMGMNVLVHYTDYHFTPALPHWHRLVILHYLDLADGFLPTGKQIPFANMRSGMIRGGGIDRKCECVIQHMKNLSKDTLAKVCMGIGGEAVDSNADMAYRIPFLPRFPVYLKIWFPDEELCASGRLLLDESADHYLTIEDAVTVAEIILEQLITME